MANGYAYVTSSTDGLLIYDVSQPTAPQQVAGFDTPGTPNDVAVSGNYAYVADQSAGVRILDISNPAHPVEVGFYDTNYSAHRLAVSGGYIYVADANGGFLILRFSGAVSPDQQLANRYAPLIRMHLDDRMVPMSVELALDHAECIKRQPGRTADCESTGDVTLQLLSSSAWKNEPNA